MGKSLGKLSGSRGNLRGITNTCAKQATFSTSFSQAKRQYKAYIATVPIHFPHFPQPLLLLDLFKAISEYKDQVIDLSCQQIKIEPLRQRCYDYPPNQLRSTSKIIWIKSLDRKTVCWVRFFLSKLHNPASVGSPKSTISIHETYLHSERTEYAPLFGQSCCSLPSKPPDLGQRVVKR